MTKKARITGKVEYRQSDGFNVTIPSGLCQLDETAPDASISWNDGDLLGSAGHTVGRLPKLRREQGDPGRWPLDPLKAGLESSALDG